MSTNRLKSTVLTLQAVILILLSAVCAGQEKLKKKKVFAQAESHYLFNEFELATPLYQRLQSDMNRNVNYKLGVCYLNTPGEKIKSIPYLENAVMNASYKAREYQFREKRAPIDAWFHLARAYLTNNEYDKGLKMFQKFSGIATETTPQGGIKNIEFVNQQIKACMNAMNFVQYPVAFNQRLLGPDFQTEAINENPAVSYDGNTIVFTRKKGLTSSIWFARKQKGIWQKPVDITGDLNAGEDCSSCSLNRDGTELFLYKTDTYDGALYTARFTNGRWTPIKKLNNNINSRFYESHACVSPSGDYLYFTSNREGGYGELDIYMSKRDQFGEWGPATNLGPVINTPFNEDTPFMTLNDSTLYFSSEGHVTMGGFDHFKSAKTVHGWQQPVNLGYPINTTDDDRFYQPANNGENAFYTLTTGTRKRDIYYLGFGNHSFDLKGKITLSDTTLIFDDHFMIYITEKATGDTIDMISPEAYSGNYGFRIKAGDFKLIYTGTGYFTRYVETTIPPDYPQFEALIDVTLIRDPMQRRPASEVEYEKINLKNIPEVKEVDPSMLVKNLSMADLADNVEEEILHYTLQVIALHNPVDVRYFKYLNEIKVHYNDADKFYRYTTGEFHTKEEANKLKLDLISKGYPTDLWVKKVYRKSSLNK
jgi:hypothetical protein